MPSRSDAAIAQLRAQLGLADEEAALYLHLCLAGPSKASEISAALRVHRNEVYRTAERLGARGLVRVGDERPARYAAVPLEEVLERETQQRVEAIESLRRTRQELETLVAAMHGGPAAGQTTYKVLRGRPEIYNVRRMMIGSATTSLDWATSFAAALDIWERTGEMDLVRKRVQDGLRLRALVPEGERLARVAESFGGLPGAQFRVLHAQGLVRFLVADERELLMFVVNDGTSSLDAAHVNSAPLQVR